MPKWLDRTQCRTRWRERRERRRVSITCRFDLGRAPSGSCAVSAHDYITREGEYGPERTASPAVLTTMGRARATSATPPSTRSPATSPHGRRATPARSGTRPICTSARTVACTSAPTSRCPPTSTEDEWVELARAFAQDLTAEEHLPYTLAIHPGLDAGRARAQPARPSDDLRASERRHRPLARAMVPAGGRDGSGPRRGAQEPDLPRPRLGGGGAGAAGRVASTTAFERKGLAERVDHRSYERQGVDREPGTHIGPPRRIRWNAARRPSGWSGPSRPWTSATGWSRWTTRSPRIETERGGLAHQVERFEEYPRSKDRAARARARSR